MTIINTDILDIPIIFCDKCGALTNRVPVNVSGKEFDRTNGRPYIWFNIKLMCPNKKWWLDGHYEYVLFTAGEYGSRKTYTQDVL